VLLIVFPNSLVKQLYCVWIVKKMNTHSFEQIVYFIHWLAYVVFVLIRSQSDHGTSRCFMKTSLETVILSTCSPTLEKLGFWFYFLSVTMKHFLARLDLPACMQRRHIAAAAVSIPDGGKAAPVAERIRASAQSLTLGSLGEATESTLDVLLNDCGGERRSLCMGLM
jgi:hypothetical protein